MSQTYIAMFVLLAAQILPHLGVTIGSDQLTTTITTVASIAAGLWALVRRYQAGGVTLVGSRTA